jgi:hypothetical protein
MMETETLSPERETRKNSAAADYGSSAKVTLKAKLQIPVI